MEEKHIYESPWIEVLEIDLENNIAVSGTSGVSLWEELWS